MAADALGTLPADQVPAALRQVARFTPARRAKAGASALASALETDAVFRQQVGARLREQNPGLVTALESGAPPPAADPVEVAAAAYLLRAEGWADVVGAVSTSLQADEQAARLASMEAAAERREGQARSALAEAQASIDRARAETGQVMADLAAARRRVRELEAELGRMRASSAAAAEAAQNAVTAASTAEGAAAGEARRLRARVGELEAALEASRRASRGERGREDVRLRLLLDTVLGAAQGLRHELALPPAGDDELPADRVAESTGAGAPLGPRVDDVAARALAHDDPVRLDRLLALPRAHLLVDGYNVTKSGYGTLPLEQQRVRLLSGLAALAARTRAEVTCVFDGAAVGVPSAAAPRGVRVLFSADGQTADQLIDLIVRAEPRGRPVVVVSSDNEVAERAVAAGARAVPSVALLRRLDRA